MTFTQAYARAVALSELLQINCAVVVEFTENLTKEFYPDFVKTSPQNQIVMIITPDGRDQTMTEIGFVSVIPAPRTCGTTRHTFLTTRIPPRAEQVCECGAQTWAQACEDARREYVAMEKNNDDIPY